MELPVEEMNETGAPVEIEESPTVDTIEEFERKVDALVLMMGDDPEVRDRLIAETYVNIANMEIAIRSTLMMFQQEGMGGMLKSMFRRKGKDGGERPEPDAE